MWIRQRCLQVAGSDHAFITLVKEPEALSSLLILVVFMPVADEDLAGGKVDALPFQNVLVVFA